MVVSRAFVLAVQRLKTDEERAASLGQEASPGPACVALPSFLDQPDRGVRKGVTMGLKLPPTDPASDSPGPGEGGGSVNVVSLSHVLVLACGSVRCLSVVRLRSIL